MGVRLRVHEGEPISLALRRFKKLLDQRGVLRAVRDNHAPFVPETQYRRTKQFKKRLKARLATLQAQQMGVQPVASLDEAIATLRKRTGKP